MTIKLMLRVCGYDHPSDDDAPLPRGNTNTPANVCMITNDSDDDEMNSYDPDVPVGNVYKCV